MSKHKHHKHHVRQHHWVDGVLSTVEHFFDSIEDAIAHADSSDAHTIKVYGPTGELVHVKTPDATDTYA
jgi:hypothetical protein